MTLPNPRPRDVAWALALALACPAPPPAAADETCLSPYLPKVSQSWDGKRLYFTSSLLANWDGTGGEDVQFLKASTWDGKELTPTFEIDFREEKLGRAHIMRFGQIGSGKKPQARVDTQRSPG